MSKFNLMKKLYTFLLIIAFTLSSFSCDSGVNPGIEVLDDADSSEITIAAYLTVKENYDGLTLYADTIDINLKEHLINLSDKAVIIPVNNTNVVDYGVVSNNSYDSTAYYSLFPITNNLRINAVVPYTLQTFPIEVSSLGLYNFDFGDSSATSSIPITCFINDIAIVKDSLVTFNNISLKNALEYVVPLYKEDQLVILEFAPDRYIPEYDIYSMCLLIHEPWAKRFGHTGYHVQNVDSEIMFKLFFVKFPDV